MQFEKEIKNVVSQVIKNLYGTDFQSKDVQLQKTRRDFEGDFTLVIFPFVRFSQKSPEITATEIGNQLLEQLPIVQKYNIVKGFLNISLTDKVWLEHFYEIEQNLDLALPKQTENDAPVIVEFSSPNTNKPLHLGHVRNNLLGCSVCNILEAVGHQVIRVNLVNDRGIHICKSMIAWQEYGNGETPDSTGIKGDKLVGNYYVKFDSIYKEQVKELLNQGLSETQAAQEAPIMQQARLMLLAWEKDDPAVRKLWKQMNDWVYDGFEQSYRQMGIRFDKTYYESNTYLLGKELIEIGLQNGVFYQHEDGSLRIDLSDKGLDEKVLLRSDGTSVYITQDLGTAALRAKEFHPQKMIYVVGNEQNYHFEVLKAILEKLNFAWANAVHHLSYGMVELPTGKMKSREGTIVDADDLMKEMIEIAQSNTEELGKANDFEPQQASQLFRMIGIGALKYFILKVDPKKNMLFNPEESIDLNGNTAPFIQYTHARICSLLHKADEQNISLNSLQHIESVPKIEKDLLRMLYDYPSIVSQAANELSPAFIANYAYETVKLYNHFYQDTPILREENEALKIFRLQLSRLVAATVKHAMSLLGIDVPQRM